MKTLLRTLLALALITWLGAEIFFPIVAAVTFQTLQPETRMAGMIVGHLLRILHGMGMGAGVLALLVLTILWAKKIWKPRAVLLPAGLLLAMIGLTLYSQFGILPAMERDRIATGGAIDAASAINPSRIDFKKLHRRSVFVEETVLLLGLAVVGFVAVAETGRDKP